MAIAEEIYCDNDADIVVTDLPTGLTVEWGIVALGAGGTSPAPSVALDSINAAVSGTLTETPTQPDGADVSSTGIYYTDVLEGAAITAHLLATYVDVEVALVVKAGQDVRVYGITTVRKGRLVT